MALLVLCYIISASFIGYLLLSKILFDYKRNTIRYRIHVNGIRGKSSVTRYVAAVLRSAGVVTYGKTTGTAARVILPDGQEAAVVRQGSANVNEQLVMMRSFAARKAQAVVMECMAINPDYQDWLESKVMHSHFTIITNVRIDHQEEMGQTLADIARSLARSIPRNGTVITAENHLSVLDTFAEECQRKHSRLIVAPTKMVRPGELHDFNHVVYPDNVAIGLMVAQLLKIPRQQALQAMAAAPPDPGAYHLVRLKAFDKEIIWANLFAVNDKESFAQQATMLARKFPKYYRVALLNNRHDRPSRVKMFVELAENEYKADAIVAIGDYEERVHKAAGKKITVREMGNESSFANSDGETLLREIAGMTDEKQILLVGTVNVHTPQAEHIIQYIDSLTGDHSHMEVPAYQPRLSWRAKRLARGDTSDYDY